MNPILTYISPKPQVLPYQRQLSHWTEVLVPLPYSLRSGFPLQSTGSACIRPKDVQVKTGQPRDDEEKSRTSYLHGRLTRHWRDLTMRIASFSGR